MIVNTSLSPLKTALATNTIVSSFTSSSKAVTKPLNCVSVYSTAPGAVSTVLSLAKGSIVRAVVNTPLMFRDANAHVTAVGSKVGVPVGLSVEGFAVVGLAVEGSKKKGC